MMKVEPNRERILEFFDLIGDEHYDLRKFGRPVLVYKVTEDKVLYSLWEESLLQRYGLKNVDGWDYEEDIIFCPDWITGDDDDSEGSSVDVDDDEDLDPESIRKYLDEE